MKYRADIDGLRAIAVLSVVLFHAGLDVLSGGYIGVDIFFVISGFLIARILHEEIKENKFSILNFYERRFKRIFPALFFMLLMTTMASLFILMPIDFKNYAQSLAAVALFSSNILFWKESNYFGGASEEKPLLHTWSLSVEEQYYLIFPVALFFLARYYPRYIRQVLAACLVLSFAWSAYSTKIYTDAAFYFPFTRIWEFLIGAMLAFGIAPKIKSSILNSALAMIGLSLIIYSLFFFTPYTSFPGVAALLPCLGTGLIIYSGGQGRTPVSALLSLKPVVFVGLVSYSFYLWHWPLVVLPKYFAVSALMRDIQPAEMIFLMSAAFALAVLSWRFIEKPFRYSPLWSSRKILFPVVAVASVSMISLGAFGHITDGFPQRLPADIARIAKAGRDVNPLQHCESKTVEEIRKGRVCEFGDLTVSEPSFALIGDSFADALAPGVDEAAKKAGRKGVFIFKGGCFTLAGVLNACADLRDAGLEYINKNKSIKSVIIANRWTAVANGDRFGSYTEKWYIQDSYSKEYSREENMRVFERTLPKTLLALSDKKDIYIIAYIPEQLLNIPRALALTNLYETGRDVRISRSVFDERQKGVRQVLDAQKNIHIIDVGNILCDQTHCRVADGDKILYADDNHLSATGAKYLSPLLTPVFSLSR